MPVKSIPRIALALSVLALPVVADQAYNYSVIADFTKPFFRKSLYPVAGGDPVLDNQGNIYFAARFNPVGSTENTALWPVGIFDQKGRLVLQTGSKIGNLLLTGIRSLCVNAEGDRLYFQGDYASDPLGPVLLTRETVLHKEGDTPAVTILEGVLGGQSSCQASEKPVFTAAAPNGQILGFGQVNPASSGFGQMLFRNGQAIAGLPLTIVSAPSFDRQGNLAFIGSYEAGEGVFTPNTVLARTGSVVGGWALDRFRWQFPPVMNNTGTTVFSAHYTNGIGGTGIFSVRNGLYGVVARGGQDIQGYELSTTSMAHAVNDTGQVVFAYTTINTSSHVIFLASPRP